MKIIQKGLILQFGTILVIFIFQTLLYFFVKRDLKGFKCMTVSLDVFEDFLRLFETFWNVWNSSDLFGIFLIYLEYF